MSNRAAVVSSILLFAGCALTASAAPDAPGTGQGQWVHGCWGDEAGALSGDRFWMPIPAEEKPEIDAGRAAAGDNRLDLVFVGDGYTASELGQYAADVDNVVNNFFVYEPFTAYEPYFRVTRVDVVSNESGVDNDPTQGITKDTALDMLFWCGGTERLLCVSVSKAQAAAASGASDVDQILAVANSSKYGGAGYSSSDVGTLSGQNSASVEVAIHEMGHSLGNLADEYDYSGGSTYTGGEPNRPNVSIYDGPTMASLQTKWWQWAGHSDSRFDSPCGNYEGGYYHTFGIYRPSNNSMMQSLYRKFNAPSAESLIAEIYQHVSPVDDFGPDTSSDLDGTETVFVVPMQPVGHSLVVSWTLDGNPVGSNQTSLDLTTLGLTGTHTLVATVVDETTMVIDQTIRDTLLTETVTWNIDASGCNSLADMNGDGFINLSDVVLFVTAFGNADPAADFNGDGFYNLSDVILFIDAFNAGC